MAVTTLTPKAVFDLLQKYLSTRLAGHRPRVEAIAQEAGVGTATLNTALNAPRLGVDVVTVDRYRWRSPYATKDLWTPVWEELVGAGLAQRADGGWRLTTKGRETIERLTREIRSYLESVQLPPLELRRATKTLTDLAAAIPADSERAMAARRGLPLRAEVRSDVVRLDVAIGELSIQRDDCHIAAWQKAGYSGPELDVLSHVWEGKATVDDLGKALEARQERADVERHVESLVRRGDLSREGHRLALTPQGKKRREGIETDTDRRYFQGWPDGEALTRLGDDVSAIVAGLPS
jgi:DNA-binding MarR family transcriptional regulator